MMIYYYAEHYAVSIIDKIVPVTNEVMPIRFIYINIRLLRAVRIRKYEFFKFLSLNCNNN